MEKYLIITLILLSVIIYLNYIKQPFSATLDEVNEVYKLDTRYNFPTVPPVNPMSYKTLLLDQIPVDKDLYSNQEHVDGFILDQNNFKTKTNQLNYSGGTTQMIKIPLQMNEPFEEQLRSQEILITPYNRIKYSTTKC
jgi:hypothetical protein